jgi:hypothetical protein
MGNSRSHAPASDADSGAAGRYFYLSADSGAVAAATIHDSIHDGLSTGNSPTDGI